MQNRLSEVKLLQVGEFTWVEAVLLVLSSELGAIPGVNAELLGSGLVTLQAGHIGEIFLGENIFLFGFDIFESWVFRSGMEFDPDFFARILKALTPWHVKFSDRFAFAIVAHPNFFINTFV